jgi:signal transduction histidine kinase
LTYQLKEANTQLQILDKARAEFISIASHQLRTPPATIKWYVGAILSGDFGQLTSDLKAALDRVNATNNGQIALIDDLLNASRIERGKMEFFFEMGDIVELAKAAFDQLIPQAEMHKIKLIYEPPKQPLPQVMLDKEKVRQVVNNFIDNAIKYTKQGSVTLHFELTPTDVVVKVTDTGRGVAPDIAPTLFDKYTRGKDSATAASGLGLGLYVAKVIIEQNKGKIWVESPGEGKGSTFAFSLPIHSTLEATSAVDLTKGP